MKGKKTEVNTDRANHFAEIAHARAKRWTMEINKLKLEYSEKTLVTLLICRLLKKNMAHGYHSEGMFNEFEGVEHMAGLIEESFFKIPGQTK